MEAAKNIKKQIMLAAGVFVALLIVVGVLLAVNRQETAQGAKTITVAVIARQQTETFTLYTQEEFLRGVLEEAALVQGVEGPYGLFVTSVNAVTVDDSLQQWWCFTKGGEPLYTGVDETPVYDGDTFEITLTAGY